MDRATEVGFIMMVVLVFATTLMGLQVGRDVGYGEGKIDGLQEGYDSARSTCGGAEWTFVYHSYNASFNGVQNINWSNCTEIPRDPNQKYEDLVWRGVCV